ncbi:MAG: hemolysin family protein [Candidatus Omnitrophota bacterium]
MIYFILSVLFLVTTLFYMLEIAFNSYSKVSLAGFLDDIENQKIKQYGYVEKYETVLHALQGTAFLFQLILFFYSYFLLMPVLQNSIYTLILLIVSFLLIFNVFLYTLAFSKREAILDKLIFITPIAMFIFYPINVMFSAFAKKQPEDNGDEDEDDLSEKELEVFFEEGTKEGVLETEDKEMFESILEFRDTLVKEIITPRVDMVYVDINIGLDDLVKKINEAKKSRYPVISGRIDNIEGIILAKDVFDYWNNEEKKKDFNIKKILRNAFFVPETMRVLELLKELQKSKQKFAIVADEFGGISGVVTMEDIIEEIVGEIHDEYDKDTEYIIEEKDHFIVKGDTDIYELNDRLNFKLEEDDDYQTVAGLMSFSLGKIPGKGDRVKIDGYIFEVIETDKNRVKKVRIIKQENSE